MSLAKKEQEFNHLVTWAKTVQNKAKISEEKAKNAAYGAGITQPPSKLGVKSLVIKLLDETGPAVNKTLSTPEKQTLLEKLNTYNDRVKKMLLTTAKAVTNVENDIAIGKKMDEAFDVFMMKNYPQEKDVLGNSSHRGPIRTIYSNISDLKINILKSQKKIQETQNFINRKIKIIENTEAVNDKTSTTETTIQDNPPPKQPMPRPEVKSEEVKPEKVKQEERLQELIQLAKKAAENAEIQCENAKKEDVTKITDPVCNANASCLRDALNKKLINLNDIVSKVTGFSTEADKYYEEAKGIDYNNNKGKINNIEHYAKNAEKFRLATTRIRDKYQNEVFNQGKPQIAADKPGFFNKKKIGIGLGVAGLAGLSYYMYNKYKNKSKKNPSSKVSNNISKSNRKSKSDSSRRSSRSSSSSQSSVKTNSEL
jgi:hypothetical protein